MRNARSARGALHARAGICLGSGEKDADGDREGVPLHSERNLDRAVSGAKVSPDFE